MSACEAPGKEQCDVGNTDAAREYSLVGLARGGARGARLLRNAGDWRHAAWSWGKQMIAAMSARKSTDQIGGGSEAIAEPRGRT